VGDGRSISAAYALYFVSLPAWANVAVLVVLQACLVAPPLSVLVYGTLVRPRRAQGGGRGAVWLWGYGVFLPLLVLTPGLLLDFFGIRNPVFRFTLTLWFTTAFFKVLATMYGFAPMHATRSLSDYALYFSSSMMLRFDDKTGKYIKTNSTYLWKALFRFVGYILLTGAYQSLFSIYPDMFPSLVPPMQYTREGYYSLRELCSLHCLKENFFFATLLQLYLCTFGEGLGFIASAITGKQSVKLMDNPVFASESPSDFWGRRWNMVVHTCLKNGVYKPVRSVGGSAKAAVVASFLASGLLHEWLLPVMCEHGGGDRPTFTHGDQSVFFLWQGALVAAEGLVGRGRLCRALGRVLPAPARSVLVLLLGLPPARFFWSAYRNNGFFVQISVLFPSVVPIDSLPAEA